MVKGGKANGAGQSYGHNILVNTGTLNLEGGSVEGFISAVNVGTTANCFINISGSPEVNKGSTNLRLTYTGTEGAYGLMINTVNGETADYSVDQSYWSFIINGEYAMEGMNTTPITDGGQYKLEYTVYVAE